MSGGEFGGDTTFHAGYSAGPEHLRSLPAQGDALHEYDYDFGDPDIGLSSFFSKPPPERLAMFQMFDVREVSEIVSLHPATRHPSAHGRT